MQRVRVGLTGLACVFLLVFLAAAFFGLAGPDATDLAAQNLTTTSPLANTVAEPREPLAELGVTPGNVPGTAESSPAPSVEPEVPMRTGPGAPATGTPRTAPPAP